MKPIDKLTIQISQTADGRSNYLQILSGDQLSINVVLVASEITVTDARGMNRAPDAPKD
jgi:hypothetical protein